MRRRWRLRRSPRTSSAHRMIADSAAPAAGPPRPFAPELAARPQLRRRSSLPRPCGSPGGGPPRRPGAARGCAGVRSAGPLRLLDTVFRSLRRSAVDALAVDGCAVLCWFAGARPAAAAAPSECFLTFNALRTPPLERSDARVLADARPWTLWLGRCVRRPVAALAPAPEAAQPAAARALRRSAGLRTPAPALTRVLVHCARLRDLYCRRLANPGRTPPGCHTSVQQNCESSLPPRNSEHWYQRAR